MPTATSASVAVTPPCSTPEPFSNSGRIRHSIVTPSLCNRTSLSPTSALNGIWFRNCFSFSNVIKRLFGPDAGLGARRYGRRSVGRSPLLWTFLIQFRRSKAAVHRRAPAQHAFARSHTGARREKAIRDNPRSVVTGAGRLWGTILGSSVLFSLTTSGTYKAEFGINSATGLCPCYLLQASDGAIYGTANGGGPAGYGLVFAFDAGLPVPKPQAGAFQPTSGLGQQPVRGIGRVQRRARDQCR